MPSKTDGPITWKYVVQALPNVSRTTEQMKITTLLSISPWHVLNLAAEKANLLGMLFHLSATADDKNWRPAYPGEFNLLMKELASTEEYMMERNQKHDYHYPYLYYSQIACSIAM